MVLVMGAVVGGMVDLPVPADVHDLPEHPEQLTLEYRRDRSSGQRRAPEPGPAPPATTLTSLEAPMHDTINRLRSEAGRRGLHPDRAAGRRGHHRRPGRHRRPGVPELPQGRGRQVGRSPTCAARSARSSSTTPTTATPTRPPPPPDYGSGPVDHSIARRRRQRDVQTITLSDKTQLGLRRHRRHVVHASARNNDGGSGKCYVYNSTDGGSVQASSTASRCNLADGLRR